MARTSRGNGGPNANVQALDNLDLDDMFADGGDDLFDGMDIDLGNMDDIITGGNNAAAQEESKISEALSDNDLPSAAPDDMPDEAPRRRKTKRKTTAPSFFDDQDEEFLEESSKKKKRGSKAATTKKRGSKRAPAAHDEGKTPATAAPRKSKTKSIMPPPTMLKAPPSGGVGGAAGRLKKSGIARISTSKTAETASVSKTAISAASPKPSRYQSAAQLPHHPGLNQSTFCGLLPSKTLFYPFLPALPQEVALKNRKIYSLLDRAHTSFISSLAPPSKSDNNIQQVKDTETIFQLMQEAFKDEKASETLSAEDAALAKADLIGNAIGSTRRTIELFDKTKLAQDLLAVCALLKRQHDFLKQNSANMERWCHDNFTENDYAEVYLPPTAKRKSDEDEQSVLGKKTDLASLSGSTIRVKLLCSGFKEPKTGLHAIIPGKTAAPTLVDSKRAAKPSKKRRPVHEEAKNADFSASPATYLTPLYSQLRPARRRKMIADLISQTACSLELEYARRIQERRQTSVGMEKKAREAVGDKSYPGAHTAGMWKWLEEMGYCVDMVDHLSLRGCLEDARSLDWGVLHHQGNTIQPANVAHHDNALWGNREQPSSYIDNLLDLMVEEGDCSDEESSDEPDVGDGESSVGEQNYASFRQMAELSTLSQEERTYIQLQSMGLSRAVLKPGTAAPPKSDAVTNFVKQQTQFHAANGGIGNQGCSHWEAAEEVDEIEELIKAMTLELLETTRLNHQRAAYLEAVTAAVLETPKESMERQRIETDLHARHAALVKRNKEAKQKNGKKKNTKNDDLALPW